MEKKKIGILGAGSIFEQHAMGFQRLASVCEVVAVAKKNPDCNTDKIHSLLGKKVKIVKEYSQILSDPAIDAVDIILPHDLHLPATVAAADAKKHVLVEKVMARNVDECNQMIEACDRAGVSLTVCHDRRYHDDFIVLNDIVKSGKLGDVFFWKLDHNQNVIFPEDAWVRYKDGIGGGAIMSCLTHQIDCLRWYGGDIKTVNCMTKTLPERMEGECLGVVSAMMESGALAQLSINWYTASNKADNGLWYELIHVCGTEGEAYYMSEKGTYVKIHDESDKRIFEYDLSKPTAPFQKIKSKQSMTGHERCLSEWIKLLRGEPAAITTYGRDSKKTVEAAEAAYRSAVTRQFIDLPIQPVPWEKALLP